MRSWKNIRLSGACLALTVTLAPIGPVFSAQDPQQFSDWSAPVNLGPPINTNAGEAGVSISKDGLSLYFIRNFDILVSQRASIDAAWGPPQNLGPTVNSVSMEIAPSLSLDEHSLFFASDRPGGFGGVDLYVSRRHNKRDDFGWQAPVNLGSGINTDANDLQSTLFEDDATGVTTLYFTSNRAGGDDIYASTLLPDEDFGPAVLVEELSTPFADTQPAIRRDGLEMFLTSPRAGVGLDLWVSTRTSTSDRWSTPVNLGSVVNSPFGDARAALSFDATELYFQSNRTGHQDIYRSTRIKLTNPD